MSDFSNLSALYINTSLKKDAGRRHTRLLMAASAGIMEKQGVTVEHVHPLDHEVPPSKGNDRNAFEAGCRFDCENPDYRA